MVVKCVVNIAVPSGVSHDVTTGDGLHNNETIVTMDCKTSLTRLLICTLQKVDDN